MRSRVDQDGKDMQPEEGGGSDCVYVCGMCEARQCRAEDARHCSKSAAPWLDGGRGAVASEKEEGLRSEPRSWDGGIAKRTAAGLPGQTDRPRGYSGGSWAVKGISGECSRKWEFADWPWGG